MVHVAEVENVFLTYANERKVNKAKEFCEDPLNQSWTKVNIDDYRDINEKISSVCPEYNKKDLDDLMDDYVDACTIQNNHINPKEVKAYNYRLYRSCKTLIRKKIKDKNGALSQEEIEEIIIELTDNFNEIIKDISKTYRVAFKDKDNIKKAIVKLFQECYLAFD